jgi:hypothetical protein
MTPSEKEILCIEHIIQLKKSEEVTQLLNSTQNKKESFLKRFFNKTTRYDIDEKKTLTILWSHYGFFISDKNQAKCTSYWIQILYNKTYDLEEAIRIESDWIKMDQTKLKEEAEISGSVMKRKNYGSIIDRVLWKIDSELGPYNP